MSPSSARVSRAAAYGVWLLSRVYLCHQVLGLIGHTEGDALYYQASLSGTHPWELGTVIREYPLPAVLLLDGVRGVAALLSVSLLNTLMVTMLLADLAFLVLLRRWAARRAGDPSTSTAAVDVLPGRELAIWAWVIGVPLLGPTSYSRFDLLPGVLAGTAILVGTLTAAGDPGDAAVRRGRVRAGVSLAAGTGLKLWPALLAPFLLLTAGWRRLLGGMVAGGVALVVLTVALSGGDRFGRLLSPLGFQADRGLQVESIAATPVMWARWMHPEKYQIDLAFNALQVYGPGASVALKTASALTALWLFGLAGLWLRAVWNRRRGVVLDPTTLGWVVLAATSGFIGSSKVFSPQYLLWLVPLAAAVIAVTGNRWVAAWTVGLLVVCALTAVEYPFHYEGINKTAVNGDTGIATVALALRNLGLLVLIVAAFTAAARRLTRGAATGSIGSGGECGPDPRGGRDASRLGSPV